ncbi:peptidoglycan-binding protein LysM [Thioclava sp. SK-1]|uniref:peptidoglycan-binding protein LysM n=1 Tax=Thioclava sp. SK-1 TaxID=1889770 RepID=UPI00082600C9|nr:peptidoglycan-binding protein LysM [Thioclava sp. SK-1]OCX66897.1 peptidoglycan-binding protein LysM [Thioclava sp. SK-1]
MGLWNFAKTAGKSLFGGKAEAAEAPKEEALQTELKALGLDASGIDLAVDGDKVVVKGAAVDAETKEKIILAVGNVDGVAAVETDTDADTGDAVFHTVEKGDTLWAVSQKALGDGSKYMTIFEANKPMLSDPDKIYPGQVLRIPGGKS